MLSTVEFLHSILASRVSRGSSWPKPHNEEGEHLQASKQTSAEEGGKKKETQSQTTASEAELLVRFSSHWIEERDAEPDCSAQQSDPQQLGTTPHIDASLR